MSVVTCSRCGTQGESLAAVPVGGKLGEAVQAKICASCWQEWMGASTQVINHYGLNMADPDHRQQFYEFMKDFLNLKDV